MSDPIKKSVNLLPEYFRTDKNAKFLASTIDQFNQTPQLERIDGYVGSKITPNYNPETDFYLKDVLPLRSNYQLEPALIFKNSQSEINDVVSFDDLINEISLQYKNNKNIDKLFRSRVYSYDPLIDWDKLINYTNYYWLVEGASLIVINGSGINVDNDIIGQPSYQMPNGYQLSNGMKISFSNSVTPNSYAGKEYIVEGVGTAINLIDFTLLESFDPPARAYDETFDINAFDDFPFDSDRKLPLDPDYITINRASRDLNPWSRYNRWVHRDVIATSAEINNLVPAFELNLRAQRPIIEFLPNLKLYNFGKKGIRNVDLIDDNIEDVTGKVVGSYGYYVDGVLLQTGQRVIFNAALDDTIRGKVYIVGYNTVAGQRLLTLEEDEVLTDLDSTAVNYGTEYKGSSWYYNALSKTWSLSQQHTYLNQPPLFDLFDNQGRSYSEININDFKGSKIFGYDVGAGVPDPVLGFPLKYQNSIGVGSYLFKNYFMTDVISITSDNTTSILPTSVTLLKQYNSDGSEVLLNVWKKLQEVSVPILEFQTVESATSILYITSLDKPNGSPVKVKAFVNNQLVSSTAVPVGSKLSIEFDNELAINDTVLFKIYTDQVPNNNGYYETPISLTNNPLNGPISDMTLSELSAHFDTMIVGLTDEIDAPVNIEKIRDISADYTMYGTRLIINGNPIAFTKIFLGKKEHNVVDAIRLVGDQYNQFKMNFLRLLTTVDEQTSPAAAVDTILKEINKHRDSETPYYRSDMIGYGLDKIVRNYTVINSTFTEYPINFEFSTTELSFKSVLVYRNNQQLTLNKDYTYNEIDNSVVFSIDLSVNDVVSIHCYNDTRGSFVPPTPTKLGIYPKFEPTLYEDSSYIEGPVTFIKCHDGSIIRAFGDYRDSIILEYEKRVYNNIKVEYDPVLYDIHSVSPGAFRTADYTLDDFNGLVVKDFIKWAGTYGVDAYTNTIYDEGNSFTWNYKGAVDSLFNSEVRGSWRGIYKYFFDTDRPHTHPWEMLGHTDKPIWWDTHYSWTNSVKRTALINSITTGRTQEPPTALTNPIYARQGFGNIVPVDSLGNLLAPNEFLVSENSYYDKIANWTFGDLGPAETAWRNSSYWPFVISAAAAILDPCCYVTKMYDVSRTGFNSLGQLVYLDDDLYLNPSKLVIEGYDDKQISGYGNYVIEKGKQQSRNYLEKFKQDLTYLDFNLFHKLGGFASKDKLQITIDSVDPVSTSPGVVLPPEDYALILNISNPVKTISISGIIVQKSNGKFVVRGYDRINPYFEIHKPIKTAVSGSITVGGVSAPYSEWRSSASYTIDAVTSSDITTADSLAPKYYKAGQIVFYNGRYYRVKVGHTAQSTFDPTLFQILPSLPITGGSTVQLPAKFEDKVTEISYGSEFSTLQEVYDIIVGYGEYLRKQGFIFDSYNTDLNEVIDWKFTGKEFLYWTTQNWADNNLITLSPFAEYLKYQFPNSVVDNITTGKYEYSLLKADGRPYELDKFSLSREDGFCTINTTDPTEGLFFATLNMVQKEHAMVFNNTTVFNDTIYDIETGYRQRRIKLSGFRTKNWNGDLFSPGFVYDAVEISDWTPYQAYLPGKVVRFNGSYYEAIKKTTGDQTFQFSNWVKLNGKPEPQLLPNFDYKINQFEDFYSLDIDNFDYGQQELAQRLTGYIPRRYLDSIFPNPISQYKFYQGYIKEKGTKNAVDKLAKVNAFNRQGNIEINEEWAFRVGNYGSFETYNELEFTLDEGSFLENPYLVNFVDRDPLETDGIIHYTSLTDLLLKPTNYKSTNTFVVSQGTFDDNSLELTSAGYVRPDDITSTAYSKNSLLDIANNNIIREGDTIWTGFLENGDWTVYRYSRQDAKIAGVYVSAPGSEITFVTDNHHNLNVGDIISIVRFNAQVNGVYIISGIPKLNQFTVVSSLTTIVNEELLSYGLLFKFDPVRYSNFEKLSRVKNFNNFDDGEKLWVDSGVDEKWEVYQKINNYRCVSTATTLDSPMGQRLGQSIYASDANSIVMVSAPGWGDINSPSRGRVRVYENSQSGPAQRIFEYILNSSDKIYCEPNSPTQFGYSLTYDEGKGLFFAGAPEASNIRKISSAAGTVIFSSGTGTISSFQSEGVVKISSRFQFREQTEFVLVNPYGSVASMSSKSRFGHSIYINQVPASIPSTLLISAPGDSFVSFAGAVYAYRVIKNSITGVTTIEEHPAASRMILDPSVTLNPGSQWGYKISGDKFGETIAISAPGYKADNGKLGIVQVYNSDLNLKDTLTNPFSAEGRFGDDVLVSQSGKYIFVSSVATRSSAEPFGKVAVYTLDNGTGRYNLTQIIDNPLGSTDLRFGYALSLSSDELTLGVSSLGTNRSKMAKYDLETRTNETVFDGMTTRFISTVPDAGSVHLYTNLGGYFIQADSLDDVEILNGSRYGSSVVVTNDSIFVGAPSYASSGIASDITLNVQDPIVVGRYDTLFVEFSPPDLATGIRPMAEVEYENVTDTQKTIKGIKLVAQGSGYLTPPSVKIQDVCGIITDNITVSLRPDDSRFYQFRKINQSAYSWNILRRQPDLVDISTIKRIALIDNFKEEVIDYLDVIDPLKGKIAGIADQELKYKAAFDPAVYSIGLAGTVNDTETNWLDDHVGELWWDLSTAKYMWYEQGDSVFRKNTWGKLFPGASIDVYEWVKSDLLPSEWASQADTNEGLTKGISGQPRFPDNSVISVKQIYNNVTGSFENVYYFWVKNKVTVPGVKNRRISSYQVASIISDPLANGLKFAEILAPDSIAFANIQPMLVGNRINANIAIDRINNSIPRHTEWMLLQEGNSTNSPNFLLEKKLFDSLLGHDSEGNIVPDPRLSYREKYGISIRPKQSMFKDRSAALRNLVEFTNDILLKNRITGNYRFDNLNKQEEIPDVSTREYDIVIEDLVELSEVETATFRKAELTCTVLNGKIDSVSIINPGAGFLNPPLVLVKGNPAAEILTEIDNDGKIVNARISNAGSNFTSAPILEVRPHTAIVESNSDYSNRWTKHTFDYNSSLWIRVKTQTYNTPLYWNYADWVSPEYDIYKDIEYVVDDIYSLSTLVDAPTKSYVKVKNIGDGRYVILEKVDNSQSGNFLPTFNIVFSERGTIQIQERIWNYQLGKYAYDDASLEETLYDQIPDLEIFYILTALKEDIFIKDLKVNWNLFFFKAVKYALTEQKLLDWAFKTSFINVKNTIGTLDQRSNYKLDSDEYFEEYIKEVKPYHSQIRNFVSGYTNVDTSGIYSTDFDLPSYYNTATARYETVGLGNELITQQPWKSWADSYTYEVSDISIGYTGDGYSERPVVNITTATGDSGSGASAEAYIRNGKLYDIVVTNPGSGYVIPPLVTLSGGGQYVTPGTVTARLTNYRTRKNIVGIKFDRITTRSEIVNETSTETFICDGKNNKFELKYVVDFEKSNIVPLLDGKIIYATDYVIEFYKKENVSISKQYCRFVFLKETPVAGQVFEITYRKNVSVYSAVDRIEKYYKPTDTMPGNHLPLLMNGTEYPQTVIQGLPFNYSVAWDNNFSAYDNSAWGDLTSNYVSAKIVSTATIGSDIIFLDSVDGILPGQVINILSTSTNKLRTDTVVVSVYNDNNSIAISNFSYSIRSMRASGTSLGSTIVVKTRDYFYSNLKAGDNVFIFGISANEYNGFYTVGRIRNNNTFEVSALYPLTTTTPSIQSFASVKIASILSTIDAGSVTLETRSQTVFNAGTGTVDIVTNTDIEQISRATVIVNGVNTSNVVSPSAIYYEIIEHPTIFNRAVVKLNNVPANLPFFNVNITLYSDPVIEFWNNNTDFDALDTALSGGSWNEQGNFLGAAGVNPEDLIVDGSAFLSADSGYSPEEKVSGHVLDSLGINVYTREEQSYALVITGAFPVVQGTTTTVITSVELTGISGLIVHYGDKIFNRSTSTNFTQDNQYFVDGKEIILPPQTSSGRGGYTIVTIGGANFIDGNSTIVENQTDALVESVASIDDIKSAYVLVDGEEISQVSTSTSYGYILEKSAENNNRASVKVYNLSPERHFIEAWFFDTDTIVVGRVNEETFAVTNESQNSFVLSNPPRTLEPASAQAIVDLSYDAPETMRKRLSPPWVSYYQVKGNQTVFKIDNKNERLPGTYSTNIVKVYINGVALRPGFDYLVNSADSTVSITTGLLNQDDVLAVMGIIDYDYVISGNILELNIPGLDVEPSPSTFLRVMTFEYQDSMLLRTERFQGNVVGRFTLSRPVVNDNYIWVSVRGVPLIARYDFEILDDLRTIQFSEWISVNMGDDVVVTTLDVILERNQLIGFRIFKDMFERDHYKRLSDSNATVLSKELRFTDTEIHVEDSTKLFSPDASRNIPGVLFIDSERIEFFVKDGNILRQLRRSTLGTGPAKHSLIETQVVDQSVRQNIPYKDVILKQNILSTNTNSYIISETSNLTIGNGIILDTTLPAVDQISVYYGGRLLRKAPLLIQNIEDDTQLSTSPAEFSVDAATQVLTLNISEPIVEGTMISIVQKKGAIWTGTESLLTSDVIQARFLRAKSAELPGIYYYGGDTSIREDSNVALTDDDDDPLEEGF